MTARRADKGNLYAIYAMMIAVVMFALMDTVMKMLAETLPAIQVAALRSLASLPLVCLYLLWRGAFGGIFRIRYSLHLLRAAVGISMLFFFAYGLKSLSLAQAYTIFFVAPAMVTALSVLILGEQVDARRWIAIVVGLVGVVIALRPSGEGFLTLGGLAILGSALGYAISAIAGRILARTERSEHMVFWLMCMMAIGATALALPSWKAIGVQHAWLLVALAVSGFFGQLAITEAFSHGHASAVAPFEYTALAWGVAIDFALWQVLPDGYTMLGAAIIIASGIYLIRHEKVHAESEHP
ncbi:DMT family transporter [Pseudoduganella sp. GCM10020061]|uniref:DMT family transporter n=1 Tax=Pseudoduganella sp. GCM10020061 TaxID=3317345 RepID=UPI00363C9BA7